MAIRYETLPSPIHQLRREMDRLFSGFMGSLPETGVLASVVRGQPAVNLWETRETVEVELELPGVKPEQLDIAVQQDQLTIKVERSETPAQGVTYHRRERPLGSFTRVLTLPAQVDAEKVDANLRDGVLRITLPKAEAVKPRKIPVRHGT